MKNSIYYPLIIIAVVSPFISGLIWSATSPNANETELGSVFFAIIGVPIVGILGLGISGILALFKVKDRRWSLAGYIIPALYLSIFIIS